MAKVWVATDGNGVFVDVFDTEYLAYDYAFDHDDISLETYEVAEHEVVGSRH